MNDLFRQFMQAPEPRKANSTLGIASPQDRQFARRAKSAVEGTTAYQNLERMLTSPVDQMADLYTVLQGKGGAETEDRIAGRVGEGLMGMGGYVKSKGKLIPHNDPRVVDAYVDLIKGRLKNEGVDAEPSLRIDDGPMGATNVRFDLTREGSPIGQVDRRITEDGINMSMIENNMPKGADGKHIGSMGVIPALYNAESLFGTTYGGLLDGTFANEITNGAFRHYNPRAKGNGLENYLSVKYDGTRDFSL